MNIQVVGTGCPTCKKLYELTRLASAEIGPEAEVEYLSNQEGMKRLLELGLMQSPALIVNDKLAMVGYQPDVQIIKRLIPETAK